MAKMNSKFKYMFDAAPSITLEAKTAPARTADGNTSEIVLDQLDGHWNVLGELADQTFAVAVNVTALDQTTGDETYALNLVFGDAGFADSVVTHTLTVSAPGQYVFLVDIDTVRAMLDSADRMRIALDVAGTTPSIDFHAWIAGAIIR